MLSSKLRVLVTRALSPSVVERLSQHFVVGSNPDDELWGREELLRRAKGKDGVFVLSLSWLMPSCSRGVRASESPQT
jgi:hypothetical protein